MDLIDFTASKMNAEVDNTLGGKSRMQKLTDRYVSITLNEASSLEMKLLPVKEKVDSANQIVCMVRTYGKDVRESTISFYSVKWKKLDTTAITRLRRSSYMHQMVRELSSEKWIMQHRKARQANEVSLASYDCRSSVDDCPG